MAFNTSSKSHSGRTSRATPKYYRRAVRLRPKATNTPTPEIPVWRLVFANARLYFVGSDDVPAEAKMEATRDLNASLGSGWKGLDIGALFRWIRSHAPNELVEHPAKTGRVIVPIT